MKRGTGTSMQESLKAFSRPQIEKIERRLFLRRGLSLGALALLSGCDVTNGPTRIIDDKNSVTDSGHNFFHDLWENLILLNQLCRLEQIAVMDKRIAIRLTLISQVDSHHPRFS